VSQRLPDALELPILRIICWGRANMLEVFFVSNKDQRERNRILFGGYTAFVAAMWILTLAIGAGWSHAWIVNALFAFSVPALMAMMQLDSILRVVQSRNVSAFRGFALLSGLIPSLAGVTILIAHFSRVAAVAFIVATAFWSVAVFGVAKAGADVK